MFGLLQAWTLRQPMPIWLWWELSEGTARIYGPKHLRLGNGRFTAEDQSTSCSRRDIVISQQLSRYYCAFVSNWILDSCSACSTVCWIKGNAFLKPWMMPNWKCVCTQCRRLHLLPEHVATCSITPVNDFYIALLCIMMVHDWNQI